MNVVVLKGNLTRDPELKYISNGTAVTNFTVAVNRHFKRQDGSKDKETTYVDCEVWDSAAEHLAEYCSKGDPILVQGALKLDTWETDGQKRSRLKVRVNNFDRLYRSNLSDEDSSETHSQASSSKDTEEEAMVNPAGADIPF
jgi:single-strand DNA-binding protein